MKSPARSCSDYQGLPVLDFLPVEGDFEHESRRCMPEQEAHNDNGGCVHFKGLFSNTAAYLYPAGLAVVVSLSVLLPCRCRPLGRWTGAAHRCGYSAAPTPRGGAPVSFKDSVSHWCNVAKCSWVSEDAPGYAPDVWLHLPTAGRLPERSSPPP